MKIIYALLAALLLWSCQKKSNTTPDTAKVNISITSPTEGQTFASGDSITIKASVGYTDEMHGYEVKIVDTATGFTVYDDANHVHTDKFAIEDKWATTVTAPRSYKLSLVVYLDHAGTDATKELYITINP